jgi:hypothetical protein
MRPGTSIGWLNVRVDLLLRVCASAADGGMAVMSDRAMPIESAALNIE